MSASTPQRTIYLSGKFLGESANTNERRCLGQLQHSYVSLTGFRCSFPAASNNTYGVDAGWVADFVADARVTQTGYVFTAISDFDGDGSPDREEYFTGTDPLVQDTMLIEAWGNGWLNFYRGDGNSKNCTYILQRATNMNAEGTGWVWQDFQTTITASDLACRCPVKTIPTS